MIESF